MLSLALGPGAALAQFDPELKITRAIGNQSTKQRRVGQEIPDLTPVFKDCVAVRAAVTSPSDITNGQLIECAAATLGASTGMRPSDQVRVPLYAFRREPARSNLSKSKRFWVRCLWPKEELKRHDGQPWSSEILVDQEHIELCPWSYPGPWLEELMLRLSKVDGSRQDFLLHGRTVQSAALFTSRTPKGSLTLRPMSADTLSNAIQRSFDRANVPAVFTPRSLRHTYATVFYHTLVAPGLRPFSDLANQLRHRSESVTKSYYRREAIPESWQVFISDRLERSGSISMEIALRSGVDSRFLSALCAVPV